MWFHNQEQFCPTPLNPTPGKSLSGGWNCPYDGLQKRKGSCYLVTWARTESRFDLSVLDLRQVASLSHWEMDRQTTNLQVCEFSHRLVPSLGESNSCPLARRTFHLQFPQASKDRFHHAPGGPCLQGGAPPILAAGKVTPSWGLPARPNGLAHDLARTWEQASPSHGIFPLHSSVHLSGCLRCRQTGGWACQARPIRNPPQRTLSAGNSDRQTVGEGRLES